VVVDVYERGDADGAAYHGPVDFGKVVELGEGGGAHVHVVVAHPGGLWALTASVSFVVVPLSRSFNALGEAQRVGAKAGVVGLSHDGRWVGTDCDRVVLTMEYHNVGVNRKEVRFVLLG